ncbi:hypothetical protein HV097_23880 [Enterobacter roggenkampii]|uniref:hypothetical protein n=1 Tax=Enterobacter roggenkampii TaxID=1812935 RepID=UPI0015EA59DB|nr:hypothetical protein [Enterobacter roggenkampii]QMR83579.1 hypothetical protein HV097_23880 [Enterobacter roggenkampii]
MNDVGKRPYRADGGDISTGRLKEIADNPYGDEEKCWLAKRVLASLEAEAVAYIRSAHNPDGFCFADGIHPTHRHQRLPLSTLQDGCYWKVTPLYTAPPEPVSVPDRSMFEKWWESEHGSPLDSWDSLRTTDGYCDDGIDGQFEAWNACRAAMLQCVENTESRCTMQPASALDSLPQNADSRCSNSPVFPDGWVMVPVEPTEEMLAELCLVKGWTARALNARYQAMLAAAPKPEA